MAFVPNQDCLISKRDDDTDEFGQVTFGHKQKERCAVVTFTIGREKTTVRADSSGSRGNAQEITADIRLLFKHNSIIAIGDKVELLGYSLSVLSKFPRHSISGRLDHYQVDCEIWQG